jgi:uncharacterized membrane protein
MSMPLRKNLKQYAKDQLQGNFGNSILVVLIYFLIINFASGLAIILGALYLGMIIYFINLKRKRS